MLLIKAGYTVERGKNGWRSSEWYSAFRVIHQSLSITTSSHQIHAWYCSRLVNKPGVTASPCWVLKTGSSGAGHEGVWSCTGSAAGPPDPLSLAPAGESQNSPRCSWRRRHWHYLGSPVLKDEKKGGKHELSAHLLQIVSYLTFRVGHRSLEKQMINGKNPKK